jgi:hypothetical protein
MEHSMSGGRRDEQRSRPAVGVGCEGRSNELVPRIGHDSDRVVGDRNRRASELVPRVTDHEPVEPNGQDDVGGRGITAVTQGIENFNLNQKSELLRIRDKVKEMSGKPGFDMDFSIMKFDKLATQFFHKQLSFTEFDITDPKDRENYSACVPVAYCSKDDGKIFLREDLFLHENKLDFDKLSAVLIHESQHSASFKHQGFQQRFERVLNDLTLRSNFDEATTDYFAKQTYEKLYPDKKYAEFTNYFKDKNQKKGWYGNAINQMLDEGLFTKDDLHKAYYLGDDEAIKNIESNIVRIKEILSQKTYDDQKYEL